jgi:hypothetical protein
MILTQTLDFSCGNDAEVFLNVTRSSLVALPKTKFIFEYEQLAYFGLHCFSLTALRSVACNSFYC